jgi:hypothetical protein
MTIATEVYLPIKSAISGQTHRNDRKLANNTYGRIDGDTVAVRLHWTDIVTATAEEARYSSGGWQTHTTKDRINRYLPSGWVLSQRDFVWYLYRRQYNNATEMWDFVDETEFYDGITFVNDDDGNPVIK